MTDKLEPPILPIGMVCTDTIEQLDPFVPSSAVVSHRLNKRATERGHSVARARLGRNQPAGTLQVLFTCIPLMVADALAIGFSAGMGALILHLTQASGLHSGLPVQGACLLACFLASGFLLGLYPATGISPVMELRQLVLATLFAYGVMLLANAAFAELGLFEVILAVSSCFIAAVVVPLVRVVARRYLATRTWWGEQAIIIGSGPQGRALYRFYHRASQRGLRPLGLVDAQSSAGDLIPGDIPYLGSIERIDRLRRRYKIRWAIVAPGGCEHIDLNQVVAHAGNVPNMLILPSQVLLPSLWSSTRECAGVMGVHLRDHLRSPISRGVKRTSDIVLSALAIIALSPLFLLIYVLIKLRDPGPAFYGHLRIGQNGKPFKAWKFRTMVVNADQVLETHLERDAEMRLQWFQDQKLKDDPRIIDGVGHILRKTSLDELPQLWNTLVGQMSVVGPRPIVSSEVEKYREMFALYLRVRPGITGLWQVSGRNDTSYEQRVRLDSYYVCNWSIWLDTYIIMRTFLTLVKREGAY